MEYNNIKLVKENFVATIRLNRPDALNALNPELLGEFSQAQVISIGLIVVGAALLLRGEKTQGVAA